LPLDIVYAALDILGPFFHSYERPLRLYLINFC
jgi:hypothetical protein